MALAPGQVPVVTTCSAVASRPPLGLASDKHKIRYRTGSYRGDAMAVAT
jgi:hypothetical protein